MFDRSRHVLHTLPALDERAPAYISCDYGTLNACVFLMWRKAVDGRWICVKEYYYSGRDKGVLRTDEEYAKDMQTFIGDERIRYVIADPSAASFITRLKRDSLPVLGAKNDVMTGIHRVSSLLHDGGIAFMDCCQNTIDEFGSYIWDKKAADRGEDAPMKQSDHAMDAVRYFVNTVLAAERRVSTSGLRRMIGI
jgi:PBSX family phage terminase large subunit